MKPYLYELDIVKDLIRIGMGRAFVDMNSVSVVVATERYPRARSFAQIKSM